MRRAKLRSIDGKIGQESTLDDNANYRERLDTLCLLSKESPVKNASKGNNGRHANCLPNDDMPAGKKLRPPKAPASPINNFPGYGNTYEGGLPDAAVTLEVFSLRRRNLELQTDLKNANNKLTVALELLYSLRRFFKLWILDGQGESYDQIHNRMRRLDSTIQHLEDRNNGEAPPLELPARWKR